MKTGVESHGGHTNEANKQLCGFAPAHPFIVVHTYTCVCACHKYADRLNEKNAVTYFLVLYTEVFPIIVKLGTKSNPCCFL